MNLKTTLKEYFSFSKKERLGIIILLFVIAAFVSLPFMHISPARDNPADTSWLQAASHLQSNNPNAEYDEVSSLQYDKTVDVGQPNTPSQLFYFDPNTLDAAGLKRLGLRDRTIQILINYRNKGGRFRQADDLQKIYGLRKEEFDRLKPFIAIETAQQQPPAFTLNSNAVHPGNDHRSYQQKIIDINTADTTEFKSLYGIGSKLAARIINFRNKLGGFYSVDQVGETYGLPDSTFQKIKPQLRINAISIKKLNINTASYEELNAHPYISSKLAYLIMKYKKSNGNFTDLETIKPLIEQTQDSYDKVIHYITL